MEIVAQRLEISSLWNDEIVQQQHTKIEEALIRVIGTSFYSSISALSKGDDGLTLSTMNEDGIVRFAEPSKIKGELYVRNPELPYLRNCLLIAAFICQHNKSDQDRKVFSSQGDGRRRKKRANEDLYGGNDEDWAYGFASVGAGLEHIRSLRLRPFVLERVFSIFVTLVRLNPTTEKDEDDIKDIVESLGSSRLYNDLVHLIDLGYLHLSNYNGPIKGEEMNFSTARYWCSLTREEALAIAQKLEIPLERYLI
jgi:hypothetical protein